MADGFSIPYGRQSWRAFVAAGHLPRLLTRMCALVREHADLGFEIAGERIELELGPQRLSLTFEQGDEDRDALEVIESILGQANALLGGPDTGPRFEVVKGEQSVSGKARGIRFAYRVTFAGASLPSPSEVIDEKRIYRVDPNYPAMLANYANELARFAKLDIVCSVSGTLADSRQCDEYFSLAVVVRNFMHLTVRVPRDPIDVQPIFDCLNRELAKSGRRLYRCMDEPWGEIAVLATADEAATLRGNADLLGPHHKRAVIEALGRAGFELAAMSGWWSSFTRWGLERFLLKFRELCRDEAAMTWSVDRSEQDDAVTVTIPCQGAEETATYGPELERESAADVFLQLVAQINRALAGGEVEYRALVLTGEPLWWGRRIVFLPLDWAAQVSRYRECLSETIEAPAPPPWPVTFPEREFDTEFPRIPTLEDLVAAARICEHDFKCSARPHDFYDLVVEIAEFAGLEFSCESSSSGPGPDEVTLHAKWRERELDIVIESAKYLGVSPILRCINEILAEIGDGYQLRVYRGGNYDGGLVRLTDAELAECRRFGYVI